MKFRPQPLKTSTPGLLNVIQKLSTQGRFRSALDILFEILDRSPNDAEALELAMIVISLVDTRTRELEALEPLTMRYRNDTRLDSIYAVCNRCQKSWVPGECLFVEKYTQLSVFGKRDMQCPLCNYTLCVDCLPDCLPPDGGELGLQSLSQPCPNCQAGELTFPVYPTGRLPRQMPRRPNRVIAAVVFREGPIPPNLEYVSKLLDDCSPDAIDD